MNLQSRELGLDSQGEDVASLHNQLLSMGGSIDAAELAMKLFGNTTRRRVLEFQQRAALPLTGVVDKDTTSAIERAAEGVDVDGLETDAIVSAPAANAAAGTGTAATGGSEYERTLRELAPIVDGQRLGQLEAPEVEELARATAVPAGQVRALAAADRLSRQPGDTGAGSALAPAPVPAPLWYAWLRAGIGLGPDTVWSQRVEVLTQAVSSAISRRIIPADAANQPGQVIGLIQQHRAEYLLDRPPAAGASPLREVLATMPEPLDQQSQRAAALVLGEARPGTADLAASLQRVGLTGPQANTATRTIRLGQVTSYHAPLVRALQPLAQGDPDPTLPSLAQLRPDALLDLAYLHGTPQTITDPDTNIARPATELKFARTVQSRIQAQHPTETLTARLHDGSLALGLPHAGQITAFLTEHPGFDITSTPIQPYLSEHDRDAGKDRAGLAGALTTLRRVGTLATTWDDAAALLDAGLHSPLDIAGKSVNTVTELLAGTVEDAETAAICGRATAVRNAAMAILVSLPQFSTGDVPVIPSNTASPELLSKYPALQTLFGSLDTCACGHCRSVLSPAAYLVDLLEFLRKEARPAFDELMRRRPDLADLELSCENTQHELPAIDVALEVLENTTAFDPPLPVELPAGLGPEPALTTNPLPDAIINTLRRTAADAGAGLKATREPQEMQPNGTAAWTVTDRWRRWTLRHTQQALLAATRWRGEREPVLVSAGLDLAAEAENLDSQSVSPELEAALQPLVTTDPLARHALRLRGVSVDEPGRRWTVTYLVQAIVVGSVGEGESGTLTLTTTGGTQLLSRQYSAPAVTATIAALEAGFAGGMLPGLLRASPAFEAAADPATGGHLITHMTPVTISLTYTPARLTVEALTYQSSRGDADLLAAPQNRNPEAYVRLRGAEFPWSLPFDLPLEETRAYLERAGYPRLTLQRLWLGRNAPASREVAFEMLGTSPAEVSQITTPLTGPDLWHAWGLHLPATGPVSLWDSSAGQDRQGTPAEVLAWVSVLLQQSGLALGDLRDSLATRFVAGQGPAPTVVPGAGCQPDKMQLTDPDSRVLDRLRRFVILARRLGWSAADLDIALTAVQATSVITGDIVAQLAHVEDLRQRLGLTVPEIASWFGSIGTASYTQHDGEGSRELPSLYDRVFLRPCPPEIADKDFELSASRSRLAIEDPPPSPASDPAPQSARDPVLLADKARQLAAAFRVKAEDISLLTTSLPSGASPPEQPAPGRRLTLAALGDLYRRAGLARALRLSADDYLRAVKITSIDPFAGPGAAAEFVDAVSIARDSHFTWSELDYLLQHGEDTGVPFVPGDTTVAGILTGVRAAIRGATAELTADGTGAEAALRQGLATLGWYPALADSVITALAGTGNASNAWLAAVLRRAALPVTFADLGTGADSPVIPDRLRSRCRIEPTPAATTRRLVLEGWLDETEEATLRAALGSAHDSAVSQLVSTLKALPAPSVADQLAGPQEITAALTVGASAGDGYRAVLSWVVRHRRLAACTAAIDQLTGLPTGTAAVLLLDLLADPGSPSPRPAAYAFLDGTFADTSSQITVTDFPAQASLVRRLAKAAVLCERFNLDAAQVGWFASSGPLPAAGVPGLAGIDFNSLPADRSNQSSGVPFASLRRLVAFAALRDRSPQMPALLAQYVAALRTGGNSAQEQVAAALGVLADGLSVPSDLVTAVAAQLFTGDIGGDGVSARDPVGISAVIDLVTALTHLGATPRQVPSLTGLGPVGEDTAAGAAIARSLLRSRYGDAEWNEVIKPVSDALRARQRDALAAYLVHRYSLRGPDDLYQFLLADVLTDPCAVTTRLLAATAAVQLFAHRSLIGLEEPRVPATTIDRDRWEWMKTYRVWEANRNVFLCPEDWLYPELRDDATGAFQAAASALSQTEPSPTTGTVALTGYLDDLVELSRIQVLGMYEHHRHLPIPDPEGRAEVSDLYLVGRTPDEPHRYFWRVCEDFGAIGQHWRGWERLDLDITGTHVLPFVLSNDLYLAWPLLRRKEPPDATKPAGTDDWELKFAWSRHGRDGWAEKKVGPPFSGQLTTTPAGRDNQRAFTFRVDVATDTPLGSGPIGLDLGAARQSARLTCLAVTETVTPPTSETPRKDEVDFGESGTEYSLKFTARVLWQSSTSPALFWLAKGATVNLEIDDRTLQFTANSGGIVEKSFFFSQETHLGAKGLVSNKFTASASYPGTQKSELKPWPQTAQLDGQDVQTRNYSEKIWAIDLILQWNGGGPPGVTGVSRSYVTATSRATFDINADRGAEWGLTPGFTLNALSGTEFLNNGFTATGRTAVALPGGRTLSTPPAGAVLLPASPPGSSAWHYSDEQGAYAVSLVGETDWAVQSDGFPVARDLHQLAYDDKRQMYAPEIQQATDQGRTFERLAPKPAPLTATPGSRAGGSSTAQGIVFDLANPSSPYYWELFLHLPLLVAQTLRLEQRFDDARGWLNLIFDPAAPGPEDPDRRYWRFGPFRAAGRPDRIEDLLTWLANPAAAQQQTQAFARQIDAWLRNPFRPHEVARLRPGAYQWSTLFSYLDTLLDAGDARFRRDTRESLTEATMLYVLAATLLGPRPTAAPPRNSPPLSYRGVAGNWDKFSNTWVTLLDSDLVRDLMAWLQWLRQHGVTGPSGIPSDISALGNLGMTYFCVPPNATLLGYWDRVEDRLFKIRHCQNIDGITRDLPLFQPPIDPGLLVRAVAAGLDIEQVLADLQGPVSQYRYGVLAQRAAELAGEVKALGAAVLAAWEKKDTERLAALRAGHEVALLTLIKDVRTQQSSEAQANIDALRESRKSAVTRWKHFVHLATGQLPTDPAEGTPITDIPSSLSLAAATELDDDTMGLGLLTSEAHQLGWLNVANNYTIASGIFNAVAGLQYIASSSEFTKALVGIGHASTSVAALLGALASNANHQAGRDAILAGHQRRRDDWIFQINNAAHEIQQTDKQLAAACIRKAIADKELSNHQAQIDHATEVEDFMRDKYTSERLYTWMSGQLAGTYFSTYQLALDMARQAERAFRFELAQPQARFIESRYWDSLHKGLLAGEALALDLKRMDSAYLAANQREQEMTRRVSLLRLRPTALVTLRATGSCEFCLPETMFDADVPGQYLRRLKSVAVNIPCLTGPYSALHARLTLLASSMRHRPDVPTINPGASYPRKPLQDDDPRFTDDYGLAESITASGPVEATGLWEVNLREDRRLPFEGRGAISRWRLELPSAFRPVDYDSITDVVLDVRYSARYGGDRLRDAATDALRTAAATAADAPQALLVGLRNECPTEWARLTASRDGESTQPFTISRDWFPYIFWESKLTIGAIDVYARTHKPKDTDLPVVLTPAGDPVPWQGATIGNLRHGTYTGLKLSAGTGPEPESISFTVRTSAAAAAKLADLVLVLSYTAETPKAE